MDEMINQADAFLLNLKKKAEEIIIANIDSEINYIFTNDELYLENRTRLIPTSDKPQPKGKDKKGGKDDAPLVDAQAGKEKDGKEKDGKDGKEVHSANDTK